MIETQVIGDAVGVQRQNVIDKTESTVLPSLANGVIVGHFRRGRMGKEFKVTADNFKQILGLDPYNPSYMAVEDAFIRGVSEITIMRLGDGSGVTNPPIEPPPVVTPPPIEPPPVVTPPPAVVGSETYAIETIERLDWPDGPATHITYSRNNAPFRTVDIFAEEGGLNYHPEPEFMEDLYAGQDKKSIAFYRQTGGTQQQDRYFVSGIYLDGTITNPISNNESMLQKTIKALAGGYHLSPHTLRIERNTLTIKPTPNLERELDVFYSILGSDEVDAFTIISDAVIDLSGNIATE